LFAGKLLFEPILGHAGDTNFVKYPVVCVAKVGGEQHHRGEEEGNKYEAKTQSHKPSRIITKKPQASYRAGSFNFISI
jgi:hypothetical protein